MMSRPRARLLLQLRSWRCARSRTCSAEAAATRRAARERSIVHRDHVSLRRHRHPRPNPLCTYLHPP
eukprot:scaffold195074_cov32-Tisochrysis_lutea.AAC.6